MLDWLLETFLPSLRDRLAGGEMVWVDPESADAFGLVGIGGDLRPERLLSAYRAGVFPMYGEGEPICWWSPDPRAVFEMDGLTISRRLARTIRSGQFRLTVNDHFRGVMEGCAERRDEGTWITAEMVEAYTELHRQGFAHSVEAWQDGELVGGVYGVAVGGMFAGESMFYRRRDASKVALAFLMERLRRCGFVLFDTQFLNEHTASLGAVELPRSEYLRRLRQAVRMPVRFG